MEEKIVDFTYVHIATYEAGNSVLDIQSCINNQQ